MAKIIQRIKQQCGSKKCTTYAEITEYACGCITVTLFNESQLCEESQHVTKKRNHCGQFGYPEDHKIRQ
jgi:hypothetical protein